MKKLGKRNTALLGFCLAAASSLVNFLVPTNPYLFTVLYALTFIGVALPNGVTWAMVSDTIDYGHWRTGVRREGITYSMFNFSRKLSQALAAATAGVGLKLIGYNNHFTDGSLPQAKVDSILHGIKALQTLYPAIALTLAALTLLAFYPLTEPKLKQMLVEIHQRDAEEIAAGQVGADEVTGLAPRATGETTVHDSSTSGDERR